MTAVVCFPLFGVWVCEQNRRFSYTVQLRYPLAITKTMTDHALDTEEMDTWVIVYLHSTAKQGYKSAVVRTPDGDIFLILLTIHTSPVSTSRQELPDFQCDRVGQVTDQGKGC